MKDLTEKHDQENNSESQSFLQENSHKFSKQCLKVLEVFYSGKKLTCKSALIDYGIGHLPRRLADLKENGVKIEEEWVRDDKGKRLYKQWWMAITKRPTKEEVIRAFNNGNLVQSKLEI